MTKSQYDESVELAEEVGFEKSTNDSMKQVYTSEVSVILVNNTLADLNQNEIPVVLKSPKFQSLSLAILDLNKMDIIDCINLDINGGEYKDINDIMIVYSSEIHEVYHKLNEIVQEPKLVIGYC